MGEKIATNLQRIPYYIWLLLLPTMFLILWFFIPLMGVVILSFKDTDAGITFTNYLRFFKDTFYINLLVRTFSLGFSVACLDTLLAYPVAYFLVRNDTKWKGMLIFITMLPLVTSAVVRTYGWFMILESDGIINQILIMLGLINTPLKLIHTFWGVLIVLTHVLFPFSLLSIITSLKSINPSLEKAAQDLGAGKLQTFIKVTLPLSIPGVTAGFLLTFVEAISSYSTPRLIGGYQFEVMSTMLYSSTMFFMNWPFSAAMSVILVVIVIIILFCLSKIVEIKESKVL